jgi:photosystem II stability/assembly factor-like uncharacterized protein
MNRFLLLLSVVALCVPAFAEWESIGPFGGPIGVIASSPTDDNVLYAATSTMFSATSTRILRSPNGALSWSKQGSFAGTCLSLAVDPVSANILYAGTYTGILKSTNAGITWITCSVPGTYFYGVMVHSGTPSIVYAAGKMTYGSYGVMAFFKSTNAGLTWDATPLHTVNNGGSYSMTGDPTYPNTVYIGGIIQGTPNTAKIFKTTNAGSTFSDVSTGLSPGGYMINALAVHHGNPSIAYATTFYEGLYRTTNGGTNWTLVLPGSFLSCLATTHAAPAVAYAGKDTIIYKSTDSGATWFVPGSGYGGVYKLSRTLTAAQASASVVYTGAHRGVFKTTNAGTIWSAANQGITLANISNFMNAPSSPNVIYTEFAGIGVHKTTNCGGDWQILPTPLDCGSICQFAVSNTDPNVTLGFEGLG